MFKKIIKLRFTKNIDNLLNIPNIIDLDKKLNWNGNLVVCPTPIGNIKDISIRNYECLMEADIIVSEDTRITKKLLQLLHKKQISETFNDYLGTNLNDSKNIDNELFDNNLNKTIHDKITKSIDDFKKEHPNMLTIKRDKNMNKELIQPPQITGDYTELEKLDSLNFLKPSNNSSLEIGDNDNELFELSNSLYDSRKKKKNTIDSFGFDDDLISYVKNKITESRGRKGFGLIISSNKYTEEDKLPFLIKLMKGGLRIALVCDSGTPVISDPGHKIINESMKNNIVVSGLPGPNSVILALSMSGFPCDSFTFEGFASKIWGKLTKVFENIKDSNKTAIFFVGKNRVDNFLLEIIRVFGGKQMVFIGMELTKLNERVLRGEADDIYDLLLKKKNYFEKNNIKGEVTIVISPYNKVYNKQLYTKHIEELNDNNAEEDSKQLYKIDPHSLINNITENIDIDHKNLSILIANILNIPKKKAYNYVLKYKKSNNN